MPDLLQTSAESGLPTAVTPYYRKLLESLGEDHPLWRTVLPLDDASPARGDLDDPLGEEAHSPVLGLVHTYPDKVLLLATLSCAVYCRYCTRGRLVGRATRPWKESPAVFDWLKNNTAVRDVLVSGGDPLMLADAELDELLASVRSIPHIRTVRVGSKVPAVWPARITPELAGILATHRAWLQLHFIHPDELTDEVRAACDLLAEAGVPMVSQTVLLKGINDDVETLMELFYGLLDFRVKPYYLFQCDPVTGSSGFRTPVEKGLELIGALQGRVSGLALPHFCIDAPGGGGKITLLPNTPLRREKDEIVLTNYEGKEYRYPDSQN